MEEKNNQENRHVCFEKHCWKQCLGMVIAAFLGGFLAFYFVADQTMQRLHHHHLNKPHRMEQRMFDDMHRMYKQDMKAFDDMFKNKNERTTIFEDEYVKSQNVKITFPENKRNLIYIFLEAMENSIMSEDNGGGWEYSVIPELEILAKENINFSHNNMHYFEFHHL